jgi:hypothetical protein
MIDLQTMKRLGIVLFLFAILPPTASAWTRTADERIAKKGAALAPPDLRQLLDKFEADYKRGLDRGDAEEGEAHRRAQLRQRIERETRSAIAMIRGNEPMPLVVERLGGIAHLVADANSPFHVTGELALKKDYEQYFERRMVKFPTVFYGLDRNFSLARQLDKTFARSTTFYPLVAGEYSRSQHGNSWDFDDRSTAFGIASICYSRAVSDLVNIYYFIWREAGGDVRSAPAMSKGNLVVR